MTLKEKIAEIVENIYGKCQHDDCSGKCRDKIIQAVIEAIERCLVENDSDTHIIAKDLLEKLM